MKTIGKYFLVSDSVVEENIPATGLILTAEAAPNAKVRKGAILAAPCAYAHTDDTTHMAASTLAKGVSIWFIAAESYLIEEDGERMWAVPAEAILSFRGNS